ncbi:GNAT family N-acetyltransferase [Caenimonas sedimenti]|nr:GNAT family N-acetyltransferase [Caenimonas sedimenti]
MDDISLGDNPGQHRFELKKAGEVAAYAEYNVLKNALLFTHTEVLPAYEGQGLGSKLAKFALEEVRKRGVHAIPQCQFIAGYIRKHPEYLDLVAEEHRRAYRL